MGNSSRKSNAKVKINEITPQSLMNSQLEAEQQLLLIAQLKDRKRAELVSLEAQRALQLEEEVKLQNTSKCNKTEIINQVSESQRQLEGQISRIHREQEEAKTKFTHDLKKTEEEIKNSIDNVLKETSLFRDQSRLLEIIEAEELQAKNLLTLKLEEYQHLRRSEILSSMQNQLELDAKNPIYQSSVLKTKISDEEEKSRSKIEEILQNRQKDRSQLVSTLLNEESWQYHAFRSLLSSRDRRTAQINKDIRTVVDHLNKLTEWEKKRKAMQHELTTNALEDNRKELAKLLMQLIRQQEERQLDMKSLLHEMEAQRQEQAQDYWLIQYQRLMESMPESGEIAKHLAQSTPRQSVDIPSLKNENIMSDGQASASASASAPSASASAPPISEVFTESSCVICLDSSCHVIFLPCGHLCCCVGCGNTIDQCPLCRATIAQKLTVHL